jgi:hypothetical protein
MPSSLTSMASWPSKGSSAPWRSVRGPLRQLVYFIRRDVGLASHRQEKLLPVSDGSLHGQDAWAYSRQPDRWLHKDG